MMKAFKTYAQAPQSQTPVGIPSEWPWFVATIPDGDAQSFINNGFNVVNEDSFNIYKAQRQEAFDTWANQYDVDKTAQELRVMSLVDEQFAQWPHSKIDFRKHLQPSVYLQKDVIMLPNGRPQKSMYSYNGQDIAEIEFTFEVDAFNFMTRRIERLAYYKNDGTLSDQWVIADDLYSQSNPYHLREIMKERSEARSLIIEEVKAFLNGVLAQYYIPQNYTYPQILGIAGDFWAKYSTPIDSWVNVGSQTFQTTLTADVEFPFLDVEFAQGVTVRAYILNKTSY